MNLPVTMPDLLTLTGMTGLLYILMATVHSAELLPNRRFIPLVSMALGAGIAGLAALSAGQSVADGVLLGVVSGALSSGAEETRKGVATATAAVRDGLANKRIEAEMAALDELFSDLEPEQTYPVEHGIPGD